MIKNLLFLLILFFSCRAYSQKFNILKYDTENGLPQNSVKDIIKDQYGFIWLTTENGIVRYDGSNFITYRNFPLNTQRFAYFYGNKEKDSIFTNDGYENAVLLHKRTPKIYTYRNKTVNNLITKGGHNYILYSNKAYTYHPLQGTGCYIKMKNGTYYIRENAFLYQEYKTKTDRNIDIRITMKNLFDFFTVDDMLFYLDYTSKSVREIKNGKITRSYPVPLLTDPESKIFWSQINNQVFVINHNTIYRCTLNSGILSLEKLAEADNLDYCISIYYDDHYRKLYLGNTINGLMILNFLDFSVTNKKQAQLTNIFYSTLPYGNNKVITPYGEVYDRNGFREGKHFNSFTPYFIAYDRDGNIMVESKTNTLLSYQKDHAFTTSRSCSVRENYFVDLYHDGHAYYIASRIPKQSANTGYTGILSVYPDRSFTAPVQQFNLNNEITKIAGLNQENILAGTVKGLYRINIKTGRIYNLTPGQSILIRNIISTGDGNFWITTLGKGFFLLKNNRLIRMPYDANKNISSSHTILEDPKGFLWISTNNGLYRVLKSQLLRYSSDSTIRVNYYRFSKEEGFNTNEFNGGGNICGNRLNNGDFVLPSLNGLVFFDPLKVHAYYPAQVYIERAVIDGKTLNFDGKINLNQDAYRADIFIDIPYYANADNVKILARLSNSSHAKWETIGKDRKFSMSNIQPGSYKLEVKVLASDHEHYIYKAIAIYVPPFFYQTLLFRILCGSVLVLLVYVLLKWRVSFLKKKNRELEEIIEARTKSLSDTVDDLKSTEIELYKEIEQQKKLIGTVTHDITSPVRFIAITAKEMLEREDKTPESVEKVLSSIYKSSFQLYNFTKTLKEYADIYNHHRSHENENYLLYDLIEEKILLFSEIARNNHTTIINNIDRTMSTTISKNIFSAIIHNLLDNSVKFTQNGTISFSCIFREEYLSLSIVDTGSGMDESKIQYYTKLQDNIDHEKLLLQKYGLGLHLVLQLLQMIEGKIMFRRNMIGTSCIITVKNKKDE
ncbi:ATP-binding protein [uncultured Chryseobacterium sp.]|uniref:ligand-binding sensor domain-containing protein n=1 Tax=uncultured Chryseobacterium sp. TaxID=259322 RepID=UPI0025D3A057|nr:ATP-binding protein [uncultured Chryseobacterium sp.]